MICSRQSIVAKLIGTTLLFGALPATAATFIVDATSEEPDFALGDDICRAAGGQCTLRAAIEESNFDIFSEDVIRFDVPLPALIVSSDALPTIAGSVTIEGPGASDLTLNAGSHPSALRVNTGAGTERRVTIRGLTAEAATNGGFFFSGSALVARLTDCVANANEGGGVVASGDATLTVERCEIVHNHSFHGGGMSFEAGADVTVRDTTIIGNDATGTGGGIAIAADNVIVLENVTITDNEAARAGAIGKLSFPLPSTVTVRASTLVGNTATGIVGGVEIFQGVMMIGNSILAGNQSPSAADCIGGPGNVTSLGGNVIGEIEPGGATACPFVDGVGGDQIGTPMAPIDPLLGDLGNNGGPTRTHLPSINSPAIDMGLATNCPAFDQRGVPRPLRGGVGGLTCDVGAVEIDALGLWCSPTASRAGRPALGRRRFRNRLDDTKIPHPRVRDPRLRRRDH